MKPLILAGFAIVALGIFLLVQRPSYGSERSVVRVGDLEISAEGQRAVPVWIGWVGIVGGAVGMGAGMRKQGA